MKLEFNTPVYLQNPVNSYEKAMADVDNYFALLQAPRFQATVRAHAYEAGRTYFVISLDKSASSHPLYLKALAIASCFTVIIPFLMFIIKAAQRSECYFKAYIPPPLPPPPPPVSTEAQQVFSLWQTMKGPLAELFALDPSKGAQGLLERLQAIATIAEPEEATLQLRQIITTPSASPDNSLSTIGLSVIKLALKMPTMTNPTVMCIEGGRVILNGLRALGVTNMRAIDDTLNTPVVQTLLSAYELCQAPDTSTPAKVFALVQGLPGLVDIGSATLTTSASVAKTICSPLFTLFQKATSFLPALLTGSCENLTPS